MSKKATPILAILKSPQGVHNLVQYRISIGRNKTSTIQISHPSISKDHALIEFDSEQIPTIKDLNSSNGTYVNNNRLQTHPIQLKTNDKISFGKDPTVYIFESFNQENEKTSVYPQSIHDERISLVNDDNYQSSQINHFKNKKIPTATYANDTATIFPQYQNQYQSQFSRYNTHTNTNTLIDSARLQVQQNPNSNSYYNINDNDDNNNTNLTFKGKSRTNDNSMTYNNSNNNNNTNDNLLYQMQMLSVEKEELATKALEFERKIVEKNSEVKKMTDLFDQLSEEYSKLNAKHNALMIFASDLQKKVDLYDLELNDLKSNDPDNDISKLLNEKDNMISILQNEANYYKEQLHKIKGNVSPMITYNNEQQLQMQQQPMNNQLITRLDDLIESYIKENRELKKSNDKLKTMNTNANSINKQNETTQVIQRENDIKYFQEQINNQINNFNMIISDYDSRLASALNKLPEIFDDEKKEMAAKYLVDQVNSFMTENHRLLNDNAVFNGKIVEMQNEIGLLHQTIEKGKVKDRHNDYNDNYIADFDIDNENNNEMRKLNNRIEELENLITKIKNEKSHLSQASMTMPMPMPMNIPMSMNTTMTSNQQGGKYDPGMKDCLLNVLNQLKDKDKVITDLKTKLKETINSTNINFDDKQIVSSVSESLRERDSIIINLQNQLKASRMNNNQGSNSQEPQSKFDELRMSRDDFVSSITQI